MRERETILRYAVNERPPLVIAAAWGGFAAHHGLFFMDKIPQSMRLPARAANQLELCLEEVFTHLSQHGEPDRTLRIELTPSPATVGI